MSDKFEDASPLTRRDFVVTAAAAASAAMLPGGGALAQGRAKYRRMNISAPGFPSQILDSYKKAITAMLALPPSDPRNWYRNAFVHTLDCPHGNWWFVVWHRGYIGWFEQTCRELSGDPEFALPYWDWTMEPRVPAAMFDGVLDPNNPGYIAAFKDFKAQYTDAVAAWWNGFTGDQVNELLVRGYRFPEDFWFDAGYPGGPMFFDQPNARGLTASDPNLDAATAKACSLPTLLNALGPRDFIGFGSPKTLFHSGLTGFGILEGQPHNMVHNCVGGVFNGKGGFMQSNLSPVDPIFFLHHANIDRIWDVWTRKQQAFGYPTLPQGSDLQTWSSEPFLFYIGPDGKPITKNTAGDYATIGDFNYDYQPGSGEEVVPKVVAAARPAPVQRFEARVAAPTGGAGATGATVTLPPALLQASPGKATPILFAKVTVALPPLAHTQDLKFSVSGGAAAGASAQEAATFSMFGHHIVQGPVTFMVPLSQPVAALRSSRRLAANAPLTISVAPQARPTQAGPTAAPAPHHPARAPEVLSVVVEAH